MKNQYLILPLVLLMGCNERFPYETGAFQEEKVINLTELNSVYDDMNSDYNPPYVDAGFGFVFSSNSGSRGGQFDLLNRDLRFIWSKEEGTLTYNASNTSQEFISVRNRIFEINSACSEKGPYSFFEQTEAPIRDFLLFSSDCDGVYQVRLASFTRDANQGFGGGYSVQVSPVFLLDSNSNEMYPSLYGSSFLKDAGYGSEGKPEQLLFSSDRDGSFDIYEMELPAGQDLTDFLKENREKKAQKIVINSSTNDHMPFVYGDLLVFSSDRAGGFGGYDLYYSQKTAGGWIEPVNFGSEINSEFDEFRPVVAGHVEFSNQVMVFSSNRPGGLGGFDLYFVGIPKY